MSISLDGAREKSLGSSHLVVECLTAVWTYRYQNGYIIQLCGPLTAHLVLSPSSNVAQGAPPSFSMKFEHLQFDANVHHKLILVESIHGSRVGRSPLIGTYTPGMNGMGSQPDRTQDRVHFERSSIPGEPVNAFGIPQATMRCLEVCDHFLVASGCQSFTHFHPYIPARRECRADDRFDPVFKREWSRPAA